MASGDAVACETTTLYSYLEYSLDARRGESGSLDACRGESDALDARRGGLHAAADSSVVLTAMSRNV